MLLSAPQSLARFPVAYNALSGGSTLQAPLQAPLAPTAPLARVASQGVITAVAGMPCGMQRCHSVGSCTVVPRVATPRAMTPQPVRMSSGVIVATPAPGAAVTKSTTLSGTVSYPQSSIPSLMRPATPLGTQQVEVPARPAAPSSKDANSKRSHSLSQEVAKHNSTRSDEGSRRSSPRSHGSPRSGKSPRSKTAQATQQASPTSKSTVSASRSRSLVSEDPEAPWDVPYSVRTQVAQAGGSSPRRHSPVATATGTAGPQASQGSSRPPGPTEIGQGPVAHPVAAGPSSPIPPPRSESQKRRYHDLYEDHEIRLRKWQAKTEEKKRKEEEEVQKNIATTRSPRNFNEDRFQSWYSQSMTKQQEFEVSRLEKKRSEARFRAFQELSECTFTPMAPTWKAKRSPRSSRSGSFMSDSRPVVHEGDQQALADELVAAQVTQIDALRQLEKKEKEMKEATQQVFNDFLESKMLKPEEGRKKLKLFEETPEGCKCFSSERKFWMTALRNTSFAGREYLATRAKSYVEHQTCIA
ncbi:3-hydroxyanthranilate 3 [Durusdinium trenchii]|uniref:3-hydroxyanthranilate 3 n=1 Tax=Durusdinium trenchii TaxID=1381693 RepID=A0ABP0HNI2_9DINO